MTDKEFLEKAHEQEEYNRLLELQPSKEKLDAALLRIKNGEGITEVYWEYTFYVEKDSLKDDNPHISEFLSEIEKVFDKYTDKGIKIGDWDTKGSSTPIGLNLTRKVLNQ